MSYSGKDKIVHVEGKTLVSFIITSGSSYENYPVSPGALGTRLTAMATCFQLYRFTKFSLRIHPFSFGTAISGASTFAFGYFKEYNSIAAINQQDIYQSVASRFITDDDTGVIGFEVPKSALLGGEFPWYKCATDSATLLETAQGFLAIACNQNVTTTVTIVVECAYTIEFRGACDPIETLTTLPPSGIRSFKSVRDLKQEQVTVEENKSELTASKIVRAFKLMK